jgi:hypothetical protein
MAEGCPGVEAALIVSVRAVPGTLQRLGVTVMVPTEAVVVTAMLLVPSPAVMIQLFAGTCQV